MDILVGRSARQATAHWGVFHKRLRLRIAIANCIFVDSSSIFISAILNEFSVSQVNEHSHIRIIFGVLEMYFDELSTKMQFARLANAIAL